MIDITKLVLGILEIACAVFIIYVLPYAKSKMDAQKYQNALIIIDTAVHAAEQIFIGSGRGAEKKAYVLDQLAKRNIKLDEAAIDSAIESCVYKLKEAAVN